MNKVDYMHLYALFYQVNCIPGEFLYSECLGYIPAHKSVSIGAISIVVMNILHYKTLLTFCVHNTVGV